MTAVVGACDTEPVTTSVPGAPAPHWQVPDLHRDALLGGVAAGIAAELGVEALVVRIAFVFLTGAGGLGIAIYGLAWLALTLYWSRDRPPVVARRVKGRSVFERRIGIAFVVFGLFVLGADLGSSRTLVVWGLGAAGAGVLLFWGRARIRRPSAVERIIAVLLVVAGLALAGSQGFDDPSSVVLLAGGVLIIAGAVALVTAPWWASQLRELDVERQARIRSDERAEVGAHLHDSVLQTLALIQKADDPARMVALARRQERELRSWIDRGAGAAADSFRSGLDRIADDVEDRHGTRLDVVVVGGDRPYDDAVDGVLSAVGEAAVNAAKHAGVDTVDVFADLSDPTRLEVFVRDTGVGFDPDEVDPSRLGIRSSIIGRLERLGGSAAIHTAPGEGTEVELVLGVHDPETAT